jgi:hypothetical protein
MYTGFLWDEREEDNLVDEDLDGAIEKEDGRVWTEFIWLDMW